jgi:hypothetical protein
MKIGIIKHETGTHSRRNPTVCFRDLPQKVQQRQQPHKVAWLKVLKKKLALGKLGRPYHHKINWRLAFRPVKP